MYDNLITKTHFLALVSSPGVYNVPGGRRKVTKIAGLIGDLSTCRLSLHVAAGELQEKMGIFAG